VSLSGNLADIALVDLLQFVHMSQCSGTLLLECNGRHAQISLHRGRIASAWSPNSLSVSKQLLEQGVLRQEELLWAEARRREQCPPASLGQALVELGLVTADELRAAVAGKIEQAIFELIGWHHGRFQLLADEVRGDDEISFAPGELLPALDVDTPGILLEAVRLFDERSRNPVRPSEQPAPATELPAVPAAVNADPSARTSARVQLVSADPGLLASLSEALVGVALVNLVDARDAGIPAPGEAHPLVVVDRRAGAQANVLHRIRDLHPRATSVGLVESAAEIAQVIREGAAAGVELEYLPACCANLLRARLPRVLGLADDSDLRAGLARLRRVLGDLRSGLLSATVSLNLMSIVADSVERGVLFVQQRDLFVALGAFGLRADGQPLALVTRGLSLRLRAEGVFARCVQEGRALALDHDREPLPEELGLSLDRPRSGQGVVFPVLGARRAIGVIYADNGASARRMDDVELVELATAQVGLAFENELLRRQIERNANHRT
jgi:hypothetical protein